MPLLRARPATLAPWRMVPAALLVGGCTASAFLFLQSPFASPLFRQVTSFRFEGDVHGSELQLERFEVGRQEGWGC